MNTFLIVGIILIILGFFFLFFSLTKPQAKTEVKTGGVVVVGTFPVIFGSDKDAITIAVVGAILIMVIALILMYAKF